MKCAFWRPFWTGCFAEFIRIFMDLKKAPVLMELEKCIFLKHIFALHVWWVWIPKTKGFPSPRTLHDFSGCTELILVDIDVQILK